MYTLIYLNGQFNKPDTLESFIRTNIGQSPSLRVDCLTPYRGTEHDIINDVCRYLNGIYKQLEVSYCTTQNVSTKVKEGFDYVDFLVIQIRISLKKDS